VRAPAAQSGKLHFGVILGWSVVGSMAVWFVAHNIGGGGGEGPGGAAPGLYDCCCLLGYCLLPLVVHALASLLIPKCARAAHPHLSIMHLFIKSDFCPATAITRDPAPAWPCMLSCTYSTLRMPHGPCMLCCA
jgi:hypothetical protein